MITAEMLDALERRYTPPEDQKCVVCGAPLQFSSSDAGRGSRGRYNCSSDDASPIRSKKPLREKLDHYAASAWLDRGEASPAVVELVKAYRALEPRAACPCFDDAEEARLHADAGIGSAAYQGAVEYINAAPDKAERRRRIPYDEPLEPFPPRDSTGDGSRWEDPLDLAEPGTVTFDELVARGGEFRGTPGGETADD